MSKNKGTRAERELFHLFYNTNNFIPVRVAGSGSTPIPAPDLLVGNGLRSLAIECKSMKGTKKYIGNEKIQELLTFAQKFGAEPWIAMKFDYQGWFFLKPSDLERTKNNFVVSLEFAKEKGMRFEELVNGNNV